MHVLPAFERRPLLHDVPNMPLLDVLRFLYCRNMPSSYLGRKAEIRTWGRRFFGLLEAIGGYSSTSPPWFSLKISIRYIKALLMAVFFRGVLIRIRENRITQLRIGTPRHPDFSTVNISITIRRIAILIED
jgi:hypothetical protein